MAVRKIAMVVNLRQNKTPIAFILAPNGTTNGGGSSTTNLTNNLCADKIREISEIRVQKKRECG